MAEMELIEQMREKRAFENALPPTSDEACFSLRRKLMEEQEVREWNKREDDIKRFRTKDSTCFNQHWSKEKRKLKKSMLKELKKSD